ncbi:nitrate reductase associated protein [Pandoraea sp.]|uniref:nitrate reductase associated protein n=1 Tax=Pandoraea sp. TaxID=1883445 RepID=UPI0035B04A77
MHLYQRLPIFVFEIEACENLKFITMAIRFNLDRNGQHLSLADWQRLPQAARETLASCLPGDDDFAARLDEIARDHLGRAVERSVDPASTAWQDTNTLPPGLLRQCELADLTPPDVGDWATLPAFRRYVLTKLSRRDTPNHCFVPAMLEFGLARTPAEL